MTEPRAKSSIWWWVIAIIVVLLVLWLFWTWGWGGAAVTPEEPPEVETEGLGREDAVDLAPSGLAPLERPLPDGVPLPGRVPVAAAA